MDWWHSSFTATEIYAAQTPGYIWPVDVQLGQPDCPAGYVVLKCDACYEVGGAFRMPTGDVQHTFTIKELGGLVASPYSFVVTFTAEKIEKVILQGNGAPVELQRK